MRTRLRLPYPVRVRRVTASGSVAATGFSGAEYGPVGDGDTLWSIAERLDTSGDNANVYQIMIALLRQNPDAFIDNNINLLKKGAILRLSDLDTVVSSEEAFELYQAQLQDWENYRAEVAGSSATVNVPAEQTEAEAPVMSAADTAAAGADVDSGDSVVEAEPAEGAAQEMASESAAEQGTEEDLLKIVKASLEGQDEAGAGSSTDNASDPSAEAEVNMLREKVATLEESLVSAELQNSELMERITLLEDQVTKAQRLIELESQELALAQEQAAQQAEEQRLLEQQLMEQQLKAEQAEAERARLEEESQTAEASGSPGSARG